MQESLNIAFVGMTSVFIFLSLLIFFIKIMGSFATSKENLDEVALAIFLSKLKNRGERK